MNDETVLMLCRTILSVLAGSLISHGVVDAKTFNEGAVESLAGAALLVVKIIWSKKTQTRLLNTPPPTQPTER